MKITALNEVYGLTSTKGINIAAGGCSSSSCSSSCSSSSCSSQR